VQKVAKDFVHKVAIVEKEAAESLYWIELFEEAMIGNPEQVKLLSYECNQLVATFTRIGKTTKQNLSHQSAIRNPKSELL
jgi:four helix bundle protein